MISVVGSHKSDCYGQDADANGAAQPTPEEFASKGVEVHTPTSMSDTSSDVATGCTEEDAEADTARAATLSAASAPVEVYMHPEIFCEIPQGVEIRPNAYGHGIFATRPFAAGETIYQGYSVLVEDKPGKIPLKTSHGDSFTLDVTVHTVKQWDDGMRQLYAFDSFMNHACDPNNESVTIYRNSAEVTYHQVALRDIAAGEEITCDYTLFEYECPDKAIDQCACGSPNCLGSMFGFKYLTFEQQLARVPKADTPVVEAWLADNPHISFHDLRRTVADSVRIVYTGEDEEDQPCFKMVTTRSFAPGEILFANQSVYINEGLFLVVVIADKAFQLNLITHTINRGNNKREFYGFDSFMNHSCDPNSLMAYNTSVATSYEVVCCKPIAAGEEVTCDYETFDDMLDGSTFECWCGTPVCRKIIKG